MNNDELREFAGLDLDKEVVAPGHMRQRWHDSIDVAAQHELAEQRGPRAPFNLMSFFWGAAITTALAVGIGIGVFVTEDAAIIDPDSYIVEDGSNTESHAFNRVLQAHLRDTQQNLASLAVDTSDDRTSLVLQIIQQNRLFETAAERNNADKLARVLRAFEPILLQLAASDIAPADADALRAQLAFELRIMLTKLESNTSKETHTT